MITYFEIAAKLAENPDKKYCLPQDVCIELGIDECLYPPFIYAYGGSGDYLFQLHLSFKENKENNIFLMLFCAAAEDEDFPYNF